MDKLINNFYMINIENGLLLVNSPTGTGKTYIAFKEIIEYALKHKDQRFFFITSLKKNLQVESFKKAFERLGKPEEFEKRFIFIDSNVDAVRAGLTKELKDEIPQEIKDTKEFKNLERDISFLETYDDPKHPELKPYFASVKENIMNKSEPFFRRMIQSRLYKHFEENEISDVKKRIYELKSNKKLKWVGKLYPSVFTREKQIIFLSMDKFLARNSTIIEPSYLFYDSNILDGAIVFIDEFDATRETILNNIIQTGLRGRIDYIEIYKNIRSALITHEFPTDIFKPSPQQKQSKYKDIPLNHIIDDLKEKANVIYNKHFLQYSHKTENESIDYSRNFLFHDYDFLTILDRNKRYISTVVDKGKKQNMIQFLQKQDKNDKNDSDKIQNMLGELRGFITYFARGIRILAINYAQLVNVEKHFYPPSKRFSHEYVLESAIRSILAEFHLRQEYVDYITLMILTMSFNKKNDEIDTSSDYDLSFYENGFRFYAFEDGDDHLFHTKIMLNSYQLTPEKILLKICEKAKVIGISATATIPTVLGNFDLNYIASKLQNKYILPSAEDKKRLKERFDEATKGYKDIKINVELIGEEYSESVWEKIFNKKSTAQRFYELLELKVPEDEQNYHKERYFRIAAAYKQFATHDDIRSSLCVLTKHPRRNDSYLDIDLLKSIFMAILDEYGLPLDEPLFQLDGDDYDRKKGEMAAILESGKKLFVISAYQTIGAGQNLQYKIPEDLKDKLITINDRPPSEEKDFDGIYLDKPTHLLVNLTDNLSEEDFVKYIYQMEYMYEVSEISRHSETFKIRDAFKTFSTGRALRYKSHEDAINIRDRKSVVMLATRTIIQAVGRMCRTNRKNRNIYIYADKGLETCIDPSVREHMELNHEFIALLDCLKTPPPIDTKLEELINAGSRISDKANRFIHNKLKNWEWNESRIRDWKILRSLTLTCPTMSEEEISRNFMARNMYVPLPEKGKRLFYKQENDYRVVIVGFERGPELKQEVSEKSAKLPLLMSHPDLREHFKGNGWATEFKPNKYIMSPPLFNNIYKGALGEAIGRYVFESVYKIALEEISDPAQFELFDYKMKDYPIYIDFKHWSTKTYADDGAMLEHIAEKAEKCNCNCILVVNIHSETDIPIKVQVKDGLRVIEIPSLLIGNKSVQYNPKALEAIKRCIND